MKVTAISNNVGSDLNALLDKNDRLLLDSFMKSFMQIVKEKYSLEGIDLKVTLEGKGSDSSFIPASVFSLELGILETLVKYMHENLGLPNKEISLLLKRSQANIAVTYGNSVKKMPGPLQPKDLSIRIPLDIFSEKLTCFESICIELRKSMPLHKIAVALGRDDRTIWTVHNRAVKKGGQR